jgi:hypothetical protein
MSFNARRKTPFFAKELRRAVSRERGVLIATKRHKRHKRFYRRGPFDWFDFAHHRYAQGKLRERGEFHHPPAVLQSEEPRPPAVLRSKTRRRGFPLSQGETSQGFVRYKTRGATQGFAKDTKGHEEFLIADYADYTDFLRTQRFS